MKTVKLDRNLVREVVPECALPVEKWYGVEFAAQCVEAPDEVEQGWVYDAETGTFSLPVDKPAPQPIPTPEEINAQAIAELSMSYAQEMEQAQAAIMELSMLIGGTT